MYVDVLRNAMYEQVSNLSITKLVRARKIGKRGGGKTERKRRSNIKLAMSALFFPRDDTVACTEGRP